MNDDGLYDLGEQFVDGVVPLNGVWDDAEPFIDSGNGEYDFGEDYVDLGNGLYDEGEEFIDLNGNGAGIVMRSLLIREIVSIRREEFVDLNDNETWDDGEDFTDLNGNGQYDVAEEYTRFNWQWRMG